MSRSIKTRGERGTTNDNPGSEKAGARRRVIGAREGAPWGSRHRRGHTEKILRRNRRIWVRLGAKIGRRIDREEIAHQLHEST